MNRLISAVAVSAFLGYVSAGTGHEHRHGHQKILPLLPANDSLIQAAETNLSRVATEANSPVQVTVSSIEESSFSYETAIPSSSVASTPSASSTLSSTILSISASSSISSSSTCAASPTSSISPSSNISPSSTPGSSGSPWCMTYSPYAENGACKDSDSVSSDVASIAAKGFTSIRLYSTDCRALQTIGPAAKSYNLKLVLGVYISDLGTAGAQEQISDITSWANGDYSSVEMIVIGNEAIFNEFCSANHLARFISSAKFTLTAAGYSGPVTTTEPVHILQEHADTLCPVIDAIAANIHPFFDSDCDAANAGPFVRSALSQLESICQGQNLQAYNLETGWPRSGHPNGAAVPGASQQGTAIESILQSGAGRKSAFLSLVDEFWKAPGEFGVEQSWGCGHLFGS
ncbi:hypothetical protein MMC20_004323 [Loxospora ochrophaea]|nr:hypothetical protein [Loxospora ochrophaea]